jgi:putative membrane protein insertion efficiency factor
MSTAERAAHTVVRLPGRFVLLLLRGYQRYVSPMRPPTCKYYPTCSQYAVIAIGRHGLLRGSALAAWRLLRCNPWSRGGVDDVPPARDRHAHHRSAVAVATH